ncbi:hypothetical protein M5K25_011403 [Dendrobium thyrsiflorum]|uniref:Uncharacterized protein n=1 Tax=Dendrobium thyrsiflorum TaxID=117978 RepID=A0ABD0V9K5_DENTH
MIITHESCKEHGLWIPITCMANFDHGYRDLGLTVRGCPFVSWLPVAFSEQSRGFSWLVVASPVLPVAAACWFSRCCASRGCCLLGFPLPVASRNQLPVGFPVLSRDQLPVRFLCGPLILQSPFFDVDPEVDHTVEGYVTRILDTIVLAVEEQLGTVEWRLCLGSSCEMVNSMHLKIQGKGTVLVFIVKAGGSKRETWRTLISRQMSPGQPLAIAVIPAFLNKPIQAQFLRDQSQRGKLSCKKRLGKYKVWRKSSPWSMFSDNLPLDEGELFVNSSDKGEDNPFHVILHCLIDFRIDVEEGKIENIHLHLFIVDKPVVTLWIRHAWLEKLGRKDSPMSDVLIKSLPLACRIGSRATSRAESAQFDRCGIKRSLCGLWNKRRRG